MKPEKKSYHKAAGQFLKTHFENNAEDSFYFSYRFIRRLAEEAKQIAKSLFLKDADYQNAIVATWFRFAGVRDIFAEPILVTTTLLHDYFNQLNYPEEERLVVENAILVATENKYAETAIQKTVCDACNSQLATQSLLEDIILLKEEENRVSGLNRDELFYLKYFSDLFIKSRYYTSYANEKYTLAREKNFQLLEKRIHKLETLQKVNEKETNKLKIDSVLTNKETEDLFKIAFRNYNHLVSVADSKAGLLININSIIISIMLAFVVSKVEKNMFLLWPTILLLAVAMVTILLSVLASRPQKNSFSEDKNSHSYQKFFFGSFDLIDPSFHRADWEKYYGQLNELFNNTKENVYIELYKESYNVRKVLAKKFIYLSFAYWVFIVGLLLAVIAFVISIQNQSII